MREASSSRRAMVASGAKLGILAGAGELPLRVIEACRATNRPFFVLGFEGSADPAIAAGVPHAWVRLGAAGEALRILRENGVAELVMVGGVKRPSVLQLRPDWHAAKFFARIGYRALGDDGLLKAVIHELEEVKVSGWSASRASLAPRWRRKARSAGMPRTSRRGRTLRRGSASSGRWARSISARPWSCSRGWYWGSRRSKGPMP